MTVLRRTLLLFVWIGILASNSLYAQFPSWLSVSPNSIYKPPGDNCYMITVGDGAYMTLDLEIIFPWGFDTVYGWPTLDANGQAYICADENTIEGTYIFTGVRNSEFPWWGFTSIWTPINVYPAPAPPPPDPPVLNAVGFGCENWDCIWGVGSSFKPDSRVVVVSTDWAHQEWFFGPALQAWPPLTVSPDGQSLFVQLTDPEVKRAAAWGGIYVQVVNNDGTASSFNWVHIAQPLIESANPSCADLYCISISGSFPQSSYIDFRPPNGSDLIPNAYTDLVVTPFQITLRLTPPARYIYDTLGLRMWVVNPTIANWSSEAYLAPVDRSVTGWIGGVSQQESGSYLYGWACARTHAESIDIHVYAREPGGDAFLFATTANASSGPDVANACASTGTHYGFWVQIPSHVIQQHLGRPIYVYGISPFGLANQALNGSGTFTVPGVLALSRREYIYLGDRLLAVDTP